MPPMQHRIAINAPLRLQLVSWLTILSGCLMIDHSLRLSVDWKEHVSLISKIKSNKYLTLPLFGKSDSVIYYLFEKLDAIAFDPLFSSLTTKCCTPNSIAKFNHSLSLSPASKVESDSKRLVSIHLSECSKISRLFCYLWRTFCLSSIDISVYSPSTKQHTTTNLIVFSQTFNRYV